MSTEHYNTIVIGTGGGSKIASALNKLGIKSALIEKDKAGGTCLNRGCIPSKMLIYPSGIQPMLKKLRELKITAGVDNIDFEALVASINAYTDGTSDSIDSGFFRRIPFLRILVLCCTYAYKRSAQQMSRSRLEE